MYRIIDNHNVPLNKEMIDSLLWELNKALRKKLRHAPYGYKVDIYLVGGACVITRLGTRNSTQDIDAVWSIGSEMREAINMVGDKLGLGHTWCNCDFKMTKSYTPKILIDSDLYKEMDRLRVWTVKPKLLLAMKLVSFRTKDREDIKNLLILFRKSGITDLKSFCLEAVYSYYPKGILDKKVMLFLEGCSGLI